MKRSTHPFWVGLAVSDLLMVTPDPANVRCGFRQRASSPARNEGGLRKLLPQATRSVVFTADLEDAYQIIAARQASRP